MSERAKWLAPALSIAAILVAMLAAYTTAYFWLGKKLAIGDGVTVIRVYNSSAVAVMFIPAAAVESWVTGLNVEAGNYDD
jgi:hypothetical protein